MSEARLRRSDAARAGARLRDRPADRRLLLLLARLPFVPERVLERLEGLRGGASVYRRLARLGAEGLLDAIRPPLQPGHGPGLWYLTDLGLAVVALDQVRDLDDLARRNHLRRSDLLAHLPGLPQLLAAYELLGALAASGPGRPDLLAWERPWRRRVWAPSAKAPRWATLPAYGTLAWDGAIGAFALIPDRATVPLRSYRPVLRDLLTLRAHGTPLPTLFIATTHAGRKAAWVDLLEDVRQTRGEAPLPAGVATWDELHSGITLVSLLLSGDAGSGRNLVRRVPVRRSSPRRRGAFLPRLVGPRLDGSDADHAPDPRIAFLNLGASDRELLDFVGRHPFLSVAQLSVALGREVRALEESIRRQLEMGLLRTLGPVELGSDAQRVRVFELTRRGLDLVAEQQGLSLARAVQLNGLAGGGPGHPVGSRRKLAAQLAHTRGADDIFIRLMAQARKREAMGKDDALLEWRNAAACARGPVRPDGYGLYRKDGHRYGFFLEYDRGTMSARGYRAKLAAYGDYLASGRFARDFDGFPKVLVVAVGNATEERFARAARVAAVGRLTVLPLLQTSAWRVDHPLNPRGLLGAIWREPRRGFPDRRSWLDPSEDR